MPGEKSHNMIIKCSSEPHVPVTVWGQVSKTQAKKSYSLPKGEAGVKSIEIKVVTQMQTKEGPLVLSENTATLLQLRKVGKETADILCPETW